MGTTPPVKLSRRELEVARLVAEGLTNREIAARLFVSERTVDGHLEHIREKLGVNSRAQVAAWVVRGERVAPVPVAGMPIVHAVPSPNRAKRLRLLLALALVFAVLALGGIGLFREPPGPTIVTVAGTQPIKPDSAGSYSGDGTPATSAELARPSAIAPGLGRVFYFADYGNKRIRMRRADGTIITVAGGGHSPLTDGALATDVGIDYPSGVVRDSQDRLYILTNQDGAIQVWSVGADSFIKHVVSLPATGYNPPPVRRADPVGGLAIAGDGSAYIADSAGNSVWLYQPGQDLKLLAGSGEPGFLGDNGPAASALLDSPTGLALDEKRGYLYIADTGNNRIRAINLKTRVITTFAGSGNTFGNSGDGGQAASARLKIPFGVAVATDGTVFIADTGNHRIREVKPGGVIVAFAGTGISGFSGDGGPAGQAQLSAPEAVAIEANGNLLVADTYNHRVRELVGANP